MSSSADCLLLAVCHVDSDEIYGYFLVSLTILRMFPTSLLPSIFPHGIPSYSVLSMEEVDQIFTFDNADKLSDDSQSADLPISSLYGGIFHETLEFDSKVSAIVEKRKVVVKAQVAVFRFIARYFQSVVLGNQLREHESQGTLFASFEEMQRSESLQSFENRLRKVSKNTGIETIAILKEDLEPFFVLGKQGKKSLVLDVLEPPSDKDELTRLIKHKCCEKLGNDTSITSGLELCNGKIEKAQLILKSLETSQSKSDSRWDIRSQQPGKVSLTSYKLFLLQEDIVFENYAIEEEICQEQTPITQVSKGMDSANDTQSIQYHILNAKPFRSCWWQSIDVQINVTNSRRRRSSLLENIMMKTPKPEIVESSLYGTLWIRRTWSVEFSTYVPVC